ncbi:MAG: twin-arginine translocase TatA/TatE family subunit [Acidimicrobiia bacterium]|nr:twin-arginine translocase TatA/TatE family subunit [Acidimicrobiia bacterium]
MFRNFGAGEIILIVVVVMLLFGATRLPQLARSIGASAKEFRKGVEEGVDADDEGESDAS